MGSKTSVRAPRPLCLRLACGRAKRAQQCDRLGVNLGPVAWVPSFQARLLLTPVSVSAQWGGGVVVIYKKGAQSWAHNRDSGSASPFPFSCLSPSRCKMSVWDGLGFLLVSRWGSGEMSRGEKDNKKIKDSHTLSENQ